MSDEPEQPQAKSRDLAEAAVVVPAKDASATIGACISALFAAGLPPERLIVVDDGSTDGTGDIARATGAQVLRNDTPMRPAQARNTGTAASDARLILFVDADVTVHPDTLTRMVRAFGDPTVTAVIGSYDDTPPPSPAISRYRNLLHHFVHQTAPREARAFWTGLGAVRREAFDAIGGFDTSWDDLEDVEFGLRLIAAGGRIVIDPGVQGTHLKVWTLRSMVRTDFWSRAVPWTRLIAAGRIAPDTLNTGAGHRASALSVALAGAALLAAPLFPALLWVALGALVAFVALNARFLLMLMRVGGAGLALRAVPYHAIHYGTALAGYVYARLTPRGP